MCKHCRIYGSAFGSRDPLPPNIASLSVRAMQRTTGEDQAPHQCQHECKGKEKAKESEPEPEPVDDALKPTCSSTSSVQPSEAASDQPENLQPSILSGQAGDSIEGGTTSTSISSSSQKMRILAAVPTGTLPHPKNKPLGTKTYSEALRNVAPRSILASVMGHADILDVLLLNCPDFTTLLALVTTCKTAKRAFEHHSQGIIKAMLSRMPQELQHLTIALIGINGAPAGDTREIRKLTGIWLGMGRKPLKKRLHKNPVEIIRKLSRTFSAIDLFMEVIPKNCVNNFNDFKAVLESRVGLDYYSATDKTNENHLLDQTEWSDIPDDTEFAVATLPSPDVGPQEISYPLNERELYRIKRALLRYEIFCALFYLGSEGQFDKQQQQQQGQHQSQDRHHHHHRRRRQQRLQQQQRHSNKVAIASKQRAFKRNQTAFLREYFNPWEVGELAVVSHFMHDLVRHAYFHKYKSLRYQAGFDKEYGNWSTRVRGLNRHDDHEDVIDAFDNNVVWFASQGLTFLRKIYMDRDMEYHALVEKYCDHQYRLSSLFVPFERCSRYGLGFRDDNPTWTPRYTWSDTPGLEKPSKGWIAKSPDAEDLPGNDDAYWGEKWMRKIGYFIWDRD